MKTSERKEEYFRLLDLLNEYPEFFDYFEGECPEEVSKEILLLGKQIWGEEEVFDQTLINKLTHMQYKALKDAGVSDKDIAKEHKVSLTYFNKWKREKGVRANNQYSRGGV